MKSNRNPTQHQGKEKAPSAGTLEGLKGVRTEQSYSSSKLEKLKKNRIVKKWHETATAAQYATIIENLTPCGKRMHTHALRRLGVMAVAARTKELRERYGFPLYRVGLVTIYDDWGFPHRNVALYALICPNDKQKPR
jgi:hypothetical protein